MRLIARLIVAYIFQFLAGIAAIAPVILAVYISQPNVPRMIGWLAVATHWVIGPAFAGYVAVYATFRLFKEKDISRVSSPYIGSLITLLAIWALFVIANKDLFDWSVLVQSVLVITGAFVAQKIWQPKES